MPRLARSTMIFVAGAATLASAEFLHSRGEADTSVAQASGHFAVGVVCLDPTAEVSAFQSGETVSIKCINIDGVPVLVTGLVNLGKGYDSSTASRRYNDTVKFDAAGNMPTFTVDCESYVGEVVVTRALQHADYEPSSTQEVPSAFWPDCPDNSASNTVSSGSASSNIVHD